MKEIPTAVPTVEKQSPNGQGGDVPMKFSTGEVFELPDGTELTVGGPNKSKGQYKVYETNPDKETLDYYMSAEALQSLREDLKRTSEQSSDLIHQVYDGADDPQVRDFPTAQEPPAAPQEVLVVEPESQAAPEVATSVPPVVEPAPVEPDQPEMSRAEKQQRLDQLRSQYGASGDRGGNEGRRLKREIDSLYNELSSSPNPKDKVVTPSQLVQLEHEWMKLVGEYGAMDARGSTARGRELRAQIDKAYAAVKAAEAEESTIVPEAPEVDPNTPATSPPVDQSTPIAAPVVELNNTPVVAPEVDPNAPATPELRAKLEEIARGANSGEPAPAEDPALAVQAEQEAQARQVQLEQDITRMRNEVNGGELGDVLRTAMARYAELKADSETKAKGFFKIGRTKREKALKQAEVAVFDAKLKLEQVVAFKKREAGGYQGNNEQMLEQAWVDVFNGIRTVDGESRAATDVVHDRRKENRNLIQRANVAVGRFLMRGGKVAQGAKGTATGLMTGFGTAFSGLGLPVTAAVSLLVGRAVHGSATAANLDRIRAENKDAEGKAVTVMNNDQFRQLLLSMDHSNLTNEQKAARLARNIFDKSRNRGYEQADRARKETTALMLGFAAGSLVGGVAGNWVHDAMNQAGAASDLSIKTHDITSPADSSATAPHVEPAGGDTGNIVPEPHNFAPGADVITRGEGWYHQFADMGMTADQARAIYSDPSVMQKLVENGAAYVDNGAKIGGYGINMPANGHLSAEAMKVIGEAMRAKGF